MKLVFPFPLWLWCFRSTWTTPAIQRRLNIQQENSVRVPGFGEGRHSQRKGVGMKALLAKAEGVLKLLWSWIRGRNGRKLCNPTSFFSLSSFSRYTKRLFLCLGSYQNRGRSSYWYLTVTASETCRGWCWTHINCQTPKKQARCSSAALSVFIPSDVSCLTELSPSCPAMISSTDGTFHRAMMSCTGWVTLQRILIPETVLDATVWECSRNPQWLHPYLGLWTKKSVAVGAKIQVWPPTLTINHH